MTEEQAGLVAWGCGGGASFRGPMSETVCGKGLIAMLEGPLPANPVLVPVLTPAGNFDQVITELGFDRSENFPDFAAEDDFIELPDHLAW